MRLTLAIASGILISPSLLLAETYAEKSLQQKNELILPQRVTVGPTDSFQSVLSPDGTTLYHTSSSNLAIQVFRQKVGLGFSQPLFEEKSDAKDPALSPDGNKMALTSFKKDARGDICIVEVSSKKMECLTGRSTEDRSPFWVGDGFIGFLTRENIEEAFKLSIVKAQSTAEKASHALLQGEISDPTASSEIQGARWLAYTRLKDQRSVIEIRKLNSQATGFQVGEPLSIEIDLPGFSSFAQFDPSGTYLYFGQYTSDTNNDLQVDGRDKSAIYRVRVAEVLAGKKDLFPEPLTSIEANCNYPAPTPHGLFMTCARLDASNDGSLEIYRLPTDGMIPDHWDEKKLLRGIETSRTYSDRILFLYTLSSRYPAYRTKVQLEKVLNNYLLDDQLMAAIFYARKLDQMDGKDGFYKLVEISARARSKRRQEAKGAPSAAFRSYIEQEVGNVRRLRALQPQFARIVEAELKQLVGDGGAAKRVAIDIKFDQVKQPLALFQFARVLDAAQEGNWAERRARLSQVKILDEQARVYYAYEYLVASDFTKNEGDRIQMLRRVRNQVKAKDDPLAQMIDLDLAVSRIKSDDVKDPGNQKAYTELQTKLTETRSRYFLYRAMMTRSVLKFMSKSYWNYMDFISARWLNVALKEDLEYAYARKQALNVGLERAYGFYAGQRTSFAGDQFGVTMRLTDDLEAHHGFVAARLKENRRKEIDETYGRLKKEGYIAENYNYVSSLIDVLTASAQGILNRESAESALERLEGMDLKGGNPALRLMLMGFLAHAIYRSDVQSGGGDAGLFQKAHRYYMLSLDLSADNERLSTNLLMNLGLLHQLAENHGQSLAFLELRKEKYFEDTAEEAAFAWAYSKALFYNRQNDAAATAVTDFLAKSKASQIYPEFFEKAGFYFGQAKDFGKSEWAYSEFLKLRPKALQGTSPDVVRTRMGYGFTLFKLGRVNESTKVLKPIMELKEFAVTDARPGYGLPLVHYQMLALGFLAQMEAQPKSRLAVLEKRLKMFESQEDNLSALLLKKEDWLRTKIQIRNQMAEMQMAQDPSGKQSMASLEKTLGDLAALQEATANPLDEAYAKGLSNYYSALAQVKAPKALDQAKDLSQKTVQALLDAPELKAVPMYSKLNRMHEKWGK